MNVPIFLFLAFLSLFSALSFLPINFCGLVSDACYGNTPQKSSTKVRYKEKPGQIYIGAENIYMVRQYLAFQGCGGGIHTHKTQGTINKE